jgi:ribosomal protein S18 acetylase RimI-like enzyme
VDIPRRIRIEEYGANGVPGLRDELVAVYEAANADRRDDPFFRGDQFWHLLITGYVTADGFGLVAGRLRDGMVGFAFGSPRYAPGEIWTMVRRTLPDVAVPDETEPMYVLREIAVRPEHQRQGYGRALYDALLAGRPERLAQLLVLPDNRTAVSAYRSWGWREVGRRQPFPDGPIGETLIKKLR